MTAFELIPNHNAQGCPDRELNKAVATYTAQLKQAKRDVELAEAQALSVAASLGSNEPERKRNAVLYLAGQFGMSEQQAEAVRRYQQAVELVDTLEHDLKHLEAEQQTRRHERLEAETRAKLILAGVDPEADDVRVLQRGGRAA